MTIGILNALTSTILQVVEKRQATIKRRGFNLHQKVLAVLETREKQTELVSLQY
jgi:DNA-binding winged helix-turn-helix (wHTH) protein